MLCVSAHIECAAAFEFGMAVDKEAGFVRAAGCVGEGGGGSCGDMDINAFAAIDGDSSAAMGVGQLEIIEREGSLAEPSI